MSTRYLRAEELARMAGLAKSTVLAAIRRGEIRSSRTLGRGTRIPFDSAREYLTQRGRDVPDELREARASAIAVITEQSSVTERVRALAQPNWTVNGCGAYATLLWVGAHAPAWVVVDLEMALMNPFPVVRALAALGPRAPANIVAISTRPEMLAAAQALGATLTLLSHEFDALNRALTRTQS
jgi:excisionase family DNA binding protein